MAYGTPLPNLDQALAQWNAAQSTPSPGAAPSYQLDPTLMGPPRDPWAAALADNSPPPGAGNTATDAPMGMASAVPPQALELDAKNRELAMPDQTPTPPVKPLGGAWANVPQMAGINQTRKESMIQDQEKAAAAQDDREQAEAILNRSAPKKPNFANVQGGGAANEAGYNRMMLSLMNSGVGTLGLDKGYEQAYNQTVDANNRYGEAGKRLAEIEGDRAKAQGAALTQFGNDLGGIQSDFAKKRQGLEGAQDAALADWQKGQEELGNMKIDPNKLFHDGGVPFAIVSVLGSALGGVLGAMDGSNTNQFMGQLNKMIDRDIAAQSAAIGNKRADQAGKMNLVGYWRARLGDNYSAEQAAKASIYDQLKVKTDQLAAQSQWQGAPAVAERIGAETDLHKSAALLGLANARQNVAGQNFAASATVSAAKASALGKMLEDPLKNAMTVEAVHKENANVMEGLDNGIKIRVPESMRKDLNGVVAGTRTFKDYGTKAIQEWDGLTAAQRQARLATLGGMARKITEAGAYDNGVQKLFTSQLGEGHTDVGEAITKLFNGLSSKTEIAHQIAFYMNGAQNAVRVAGANYVTPTKYHAKDGTYVPYYKDVDFEEAYPTYADAPVTGIDPTLGNIPQR